MQIPVTNQLKYLGVILDSNLNFKDHAQYMLRKIDLIYLKRLKPISRGDSCPHIKILPKYQFFKIEFIFYIPLKHT